MPNAFLEKIEPYILSDDPIVQEFALDALKGYPLVPPEWTNRLLEEAIRSEDKKRTILLHAHDFPLNEASVRILLNLWEATDLLKYPMLISYFKNLNPEWIVKYENDLPKEFNEDFLSFRRFLAESSEEELQKELDEVLADLEKEKFIDSNLYSVAKAIQDRLLAKGFYNEETVDFIMKQELEKQWFTFTGILAVRAIGKLKMEKYIPVLAGFLKRDEDLLIEEAASALSQFQTDKVAEAVGPYAKGADYLFPLDVLNNTKTPLAEEILAESYEHVDMEGKALVIRGLAYHLSEKAFPLMEDYIDNKYSNGIFEMDLVYYGLHAILEKDHPEMNQWKKEYEKREEARTASIKEITGTKQNNQPVIKSEKVGRNEKCPCGSGKKYKKCCGR